MADNVGYTPGAGATIAADDVGGVLHQRVKVAVGGDGVAADLASGAGAVSAAVPRVTLASDDPAVAAIGAKADAAVIDPSVAASMISLLKGLISGLPFAAGAARPSASFVRPADTTAYDAGDLVANNTAAGSVLALSLTAGRAAANVAATGLIRRATLRKSSNTIGAGFRIHYFSSAPTVANGDNGAFSSNNSANYLGYMDLTMDRQFSDGAVGSGVANTGTEIMFTAQVVYALIEVTTSYVPANAETFALTLNVLQY